MEEGQITESRIDLSVRRILSVKEKLGLLEEGGAELAPALTTSEREGLAGPAARAALECITVLKNEGTHAVYPEEPVLPIGGTGNIFVSGPTANSLNALNGGWSGTWQGKNPAYNTPGRLTAIEGLREEFGLERVVFEELASMEFNDSDVRRVVKSLQRSQPEVAILFLGEMPYTEVAGDIGDLRLPDNQLDLVRAVAETGTQIVGVFVEGRPRTFLRLKGNWMQWSWLISLEILGRRPLPKFSADHSIHLAVCHSLGHATHPATLPTTGRGRKTCTSSPRRTHSSRNTYSVMA